HILITEFMTLYNDPHAQLPPLKLQYKDFSQWRNSPQQKKAIKQQETFWLHQFPGNDAIPVLDLPTDYPRPEMQSFEGASVDFTLSETLSKTLFDIAAESNTTLYMTILSIYTILLSKLSGREDIVVGTPIAARGRSDLQNIIGMFVNTLAIRNFPETAKTFDGYLKEVKERTLEAYENQDYQFEDLVDKVTQQRDTSRNPVFDVMFNLLNQADFNSGSTAAANPEQGSFVHKESTSKFDLNLTAVNMAGRLFFNLQYCTELFNADTIDRFINYFKKIIEELTVKKNSKLSQIEIITSEEKQEILDLSWGVYQQLDTSETIHHWFQKQADRTPDHIAVCAPSLSPPSLSPRKLTLTYRELNKRADRLARLLRQKGAGPDSIVGLMVERSGEMIIGILGIMKAGGAYLPVDAQYPEERKNYMLLDSGVKLLLKYGVEIETGSLPEDVEIIDLENRDIYRGDAGNLDDNRQNGENGRPGPAYVIYTSGSTGKPKGVMVEHSNMVNLISFQYRHTNIDNSKILQFSTISFDASIQEILSALLSGGTIVLIDKETRSDIPRLLRLIAEHQIKTVFMPISLLKIIFNEEEYIKRFPLCIRHIQTAGEQVIIGENFKKYLKEKNIYLHNHYGPSETHVATTLTIDPRGEIPELPTIGRPISNTGIYILDKARQLVPNGVAGELYISGAQVGRGYLGREELTAQRFMENPFAPGEKMYRTGDLARRRAGEAGEIQFLGRLDHQVKIRGFRVELEEIENLLLNHPAIKETVVAAGERKDDKYLCAYFVSPENLPVPRVREYLAAALPGYMIPAYFVPMPEIPHTPSGKINRRALPEPRFDTITEEYVPPQNAVEASLVDVWSDVLAVDKKNIGRTSDFFELGGHSLKAIQLAAKIQKTLEVNLPLKDIFKHTVIKTMAARIGDMQPRRHIAVEPAEEKEYYPVSSVQKRLYILQQIQPAGTVYNMPSAVKLTGRLDLEKLEKTFSKLIHRHQNLRTSFHLKDGKPVQVIHNKTAFKIETLTQEQCRPFNLEEAPLMRAAVKKISPGEHLLFIDTHHIISDGVSTAILTRDFAALYNDEEPPRLKHRYIDYSEWQNRREINGELDEQETYWLRQFQEPVPPLKLPLDFTRTPSFQGAALRFSLGVRESAALNRAAGREGVTLYMYLLTIFSVFLSRQGGRDDVVVCTPVAGRGHADLENIAGMFVNTLPLRNFPAREKTFAHFLQEVKERALEAFQNQDYPLEKLVEHIGNDDFLNILFALQNAEMPVVEIPGLGFEPVATQTHSARFDLSLTASENEGKLYFKMIYSTDLFAAETAERMKDRFLVLTRGILAADTGALIKDFDFQAQADKTLLHRLNNTRGDFPQDKTLHQMLDEQARKTPETIAILNWQPGNNSLTYRELNTLSGLLAGALREAGVQTGTITALIADVSPKTMTAIPGIMKSGAVYLPIDPGFPGQRIEYMLKDSAAQVLVTTRSIFNESFPAYNAVNNVIEKVLYLEDFSQDCRETSKPAVYKPSAVPGDFAYALYTSGSTGRPKGVLITHANAVNHLWGMMTRYRFDESMRHILLAPLFFDPSIRQIFLPLITGGKLLPVPREIIAGINRLPGILESCKIDVLNAVPSLVKAILDHMAEENKENNLTLKYAILGGEAFPGTLLARLKKLRGVERIINVYGPTEATIDHITYECEVEESQPVIPIGLPLLNCGVLILDEGNHRRCPGIPGEIYLTGKGVGAGYLNRQELTSELFVDNPFEPGEKMYRTGDLGRVSLSTGNVEFLGRIDGQVKIRGQRVEVEEIENRLLKHEAIKEAVVIAGGDSENKRLHAYIVTAPAPPPETGELQEFLALQLPNFMIPSSFTVLEQLPYTPNNKIDRKALPDPEIQQTSFHKAPRSITEEKLAALWSGILKEPSLSTADIGIDDDFFQLGGHSLKAAQLVSRISKTFAVEFPLSRVFAQPTIREAAEFITAAKKQKYEKINNVEKKKYYQLSSAQKRLFFLDRFEDTGTGYNIPRVFKAEGKADVKRFTGVFAALAARHEILRTSFHMFEDTPVQRVHEPDDIEFRVEHFGLGADKNSLHFFRPFELSRAPLLRVGIDETSTDEFLLLIDMHHIIGDGTSSAILAEEFLQLYRGEQPPANRALQYKDFALWQNRLLESGGLKEQADYWLGIYPRGEEIPALDIPADFPRPASISFQGDHFSVRLGNNDTSAFKKLGASHGATLFMNLLAASNVLLYKYTGQEDIITGTTTAGRPHEDLQRIIGIFINQLALRNRPKGDKSYLEFLMEVKSHCIAAFENPDLPFEELVDLLKVERDVTRNPLFEFSLVVQNFAAFADTMNQDNGTGFTAVIPENKTSQFDLTIVAYEAGDELVFSFEYRTALFKKETIQRLAAHFLTVIRQAAMDPQLTIAGADILSDSEKQLLLHDFNNTRVPY
ncbi:MAG: amino acid adenylation domain-containing protein, partial [bacterium]|nr:amino acid adenylation domain-containing protein [bacterium]